jgi:hypothetical protein
MALVPRIVDGSESFGITWRPADVFGRAPSLGFQQAWIALARYRIDKTFDLDGVLPTITEVVEIAQSLCAGVFDNAVEPCLPCIEWTVGPIRIG